MIKLFEWWRELKPHIDRELHRELTQAEIAEQQATVDAVNAFMKSLLPAVMRYCELLIIAAVLLAAWRAASGFNAWIVGALIFALANAAWLRFVGLLPERKVEPRPIDAFKKEFAWRAVTSIALSIVLFWVGYRISLVLEDVQFGAKNPEPPPAASTTYKPPPPSSFQPAPKPKPAPQNGIAPKG